MKQYARKPSNLPIGSAQIFSIVRGKRHVARSTKHKCRTLREEKINKLTSVLLNFWGICQRTILKVCRIRNKALNLFKRLIELLMFYKQLAGRDKAKKVASVYKAGAKHSFRTFLKVALLYDEKKTQCYNNKTLNVN